MTNMGEVGVVGSESKMKNADYQKDILPKLRDIKSALERLSDLVTEDENLRKIIGEKISTGELVDSRRSHNRNTYNFHLSFWKKLDRLLKRDMEGNADGDEESILEKYDKKELEVITGKITKILKEINENIGWIYLQYRDYVLKIVRKSKDEFMFLDNEEIESVALWKLLVSIEQFDEHKGSKFSSFLTNNIYRALFQENGKNMVRRLTGILNQQGVKINQKEVSKIYDFVGEYKNKLKKQNEMIDENIEDLTQKVQREFGLAPEMSLKIIRVILQNIRNVKPDRSIYLIDHYTGEEKFIPDAVLHNESNRQGGQDGVIGEYSLDAISNGGVEESVHKKMVGELMREVLEEVVSLGDEKRMAIVTDRLLMKNGKQKTLQELADRFDVGRERMRQLESDVYKKVKEALEKRGYTPEDFL
jgi:DNA-directed RNA polymerase specialized sigma subunit